MSSSGRDQASSAIWVAVSQVELPAKKYFKIGEVAHLVSVEPHVLRYWQTQFVQVRPHKSRSGHRLYRRKDVETLLAIKELLHVQRFTIAGARQALRNAVVHRGDTTRPPMPAEPEAKPEQAELDLLGLEGPALQNAMEKELVTSGSSEAVVEVEVGEEIITAPPAAASTAADEQPISAVAGDEKSVACPATSENGELEPHRVVSEQRADIAGPLNFPMIGVDREALEQARQEVLALMTFVDSDRLQGHRKLKVPQSAAAPTT